MKSIQEYDLSYIPNISLKKQFQQKKQTSYVLPHLSHDLSRRHVFSLSISHHHSLYMSLLFFTHFYSCINQIIYLLIIIKIIHDSQIPQNRRQANRYMKRCSASLSIREMQIRTTERDPLTPAGMAMTKQTRNHKYWRDCEEKGTLTYCW